MPSRHFLTPCPSGKEGESVSVVVACIEERLGRKRSKRNPEAVNSASIHSQRKQVRPQGSRKVDDTPPTSEGKISGADDMGAPSAARNARPSSLRAAKPVSGYELWDDPMSNHPDVRWEQPTLDNAAWEDVGAVEPPRSLEELKMRDSQIQVDQVNDMVPIWMRGIEAASKGEVFRMGELLEALEKRVDPWSSFKADGGEWKDSVPRGGGWGASLSANDDRGWGHKWTDKQSLDKELDDLSSLNTMESAIEGMQDVVQPRAGGVLDVFDDSFVEDIALQEAAGPERKKRMHLFFRLSTDDKVKAIHDLVRRPKTPLLSSRARK